MNVLGWAYRAAPRPVGFDWHVDGELALLLSAAGEPRDRLALQVACFGAGCNLLPVAPALTLGLDDARRIGAETDIHGQLCNLSGKAQFTLTLTCGNTLNCQPTSGRRWMAWRRARLDQTRENTRNLTTLLAGLGEAATPVRHHKDTVQCDILIHRAQIAAVKNIIKARAALIDDRTNQNLLLTGPWPPFGFADVTSTRNAAA